jgi:CrcB protein
VTALLLVMLGSAVGAPLRYVVDREIQTRHERVFPLGTLVVNVSGSFALGLLVGAAHAGGASDLAVKAVGTGAIGAFTTFSTFSWETLQMLEEGSVWQATANVAVSVSAGLAAAAAGFWLPTLS